MPVKLCNRSFSKMIKYRNLISFIFYIFIFSSIFFSGFFWDDYSFIFESKKFLTATNPFLFWSENSTYSKAWPLGYSFFGFYLKFSEIILFIIK